jgi:hypothetical protein
VTLRCLQRLGYPMGPYGVTSTGNFDAEVVGWLPAEGWTQGPRIQLDAPPIGRLPSHPPPHDLLPEPKPAAALTDLMPHSGWPPTPGRCDCRTLCILEHRSGDGGAPTEGRLRACAPPGACG